MTHLHHSANPQQNPQTNLWEYHCTCGKIIKSNDAATRHERRENSRGDSPCIGVA